MPLTPPVISEFDPVVEAEGSVDPLLLQGVYERLADRILPALTVRMARPRFLTAMAVGAAVCADYDDEALAADGLTPPWLAYEWLVMSAFAHCRDEVEARWGLPGIRKVETCQREKRPLSAAAYLKTPKVFGFHGIYKTLASGLQILTEDMRLDDGGYALVRAWEKDQGLEGFLDSNSGQGAALRKDLRKALNKTLAAGQVERPIKRLSQAIVKRLDPERCGPREKKVLSHRLRMAEDIERPEDPQAVHMRRELIVALEQRDEGVHAEGEVELFRELMKRGSDELRARLSAIDAFEALCRPIGEAFDLIRYLSTATPDGAVDAPLFAEGPLAAALADRVATACGRIEENERLLGWEPDTADIVGGFKSAAGPADLFHAVLAHHQMSQQKKPPDGKRPWVETLKGDRVVVRAAYRAKAPPEGKLHYLHNYRMPTLSGFLYDLGRLSA